MDNPMTGAEVEELESLVEMTGSRGWKILRNLMNEHRLYCKNQSNIMLRKYKDREAGEWLVKSDETRFILEIAKERINELKTRQNEGI